jgi:hypothetical protein
MKRHTNDNNGRVTGHQLLPVHFKFTHPTAVTVCIAGTFDDGLPESKPTRPMGDTRWLKETVLPCDLGNIAWSWTGYGYLINWSKRPWPIPSGRGTPVLRCPAHLKHLTSPRLDFCNQRTKINRKSKTT